MKVYFSLFIFTLSVLVSCGEKKGEPQEVKQSLTTQEETDLYNSAVRIFGALPDKMQGGESDTPELIELGKKLYFETKLSVNGTQSCNTCHDINTKAGVDNKKTSPGAIEGKIGRRNSPTVLNAGYQFVQFWDGRAADLKEQAKGPIINPDEMAMPNEKAVEKAILKIPEYKDMFDKAYPNDRTKITYDNIANAIAAFERTLISKSRYDQYIAGNRSALSGEEKLGLKKFIEVGCITCHTGPLFGGNIYQKMGLVNAYENTSDTGRYEVTRVETDKYMFKVAMLRNAALTEPYFHDGTVPTLEEAVKKMAWLNLGKKLSQEDVKSIVAFLKALTDTKLERGIAGQ